LYSGRLNTREEDQNYNFYHRTWKSEVTEALKRMNNGIAIGLGNISIEIWKGQGKKKTYDD